MGTEDDLYDNLEEGENNTDTLLHHFLPVPYSITCVLGLMGNVLILAVFVRYEKIKTMTDTFLVNLAIADILFLLTLPFLAYEAAHSWVFGEIMCKIIRGAYRINLYTSMLILTSITFDRFISITNATKANKYRVTKQKWRCGVCICLWALALLLAIPQFLYSTTKGENKCFEVFELSIMQLVVVSLQMIVGFLLPLVSMIFCYSFILRTLVNARGVQKKKSMKIIVAIVVMFIATQLPYNSLVLALALNNGLHQKKSFFQICIIMEAVAYFHACLNPVLYFFVGTKFRKYFWKMLNALGLKKVAEETSDNLRGTDGESKNISATTNLNVTSV
ncbi:C-X-C chemokine receptor type 6-like [Dendropsophus ebraccatus]|uniref:C-X-C chemokine receptor type 6-like n=1 Tax=Dendropsophus ebraccatus TaxID=150705 RepID=UPI003831F9F1